MKIYSGCPSISSHDQIKCGVPITLVYLTCAIPQWILFLYAFKSQVSYSHMSLVFQTHNLDVYSNPESLRSELSSYLSLEPRTIEVRVKLLFFNLENPKDNQLLFAGVTFFKTYKWLINDS